MPLMEIVQIHITDDDEIIVSDTRYGITERIDVGPFPTWPSASESNDMVADAVRKVLDAVHTADTGEKVER